MKLSPAFIQSCSPSNLALFLDVDGTLLEFAERPDGVMVAPSLKQRLRGLSQALGGALALVSGRNLDDLDHLFGLPHLAAAGLHGMEWRTTGGKREAVEVNTAQLEVVRGKLTQYAQQNPAVIIENKVRTLALHYRAKPALKQEVIALARRCVSELDGFHLIEGNCVVEMKPKGVNKGLAIERYMQQAPFHGRRGLFIGDDVTDEDGFRTMVTLGGVGVKVGAGPTLASHRLDCPQQVNAWLQQLYEHISAT